MSNIQRTGKRKILCGQQLCKQIHLQFLFPHDKI